MRGDPFEVSKARGSAKAGLKLAEDMARQARFNMTVSGGRPSQKTGRIARRLREANPAAIKSAGESAANSTKQSVIRGLGPGRPDYVGRR